MSGKPSTVGDIMTREVVTLFEEENLEFLEEGMKRYGFRHLPVVDGDQLVGLVTHRDLLRAAVSSLMPGGVNRELEYERRHFVSDIMVRDVETARAETPLVEAARLMRQHKIGCLPVVDDDKKLIGLVTESDFLNLSIELLTRE